MMPAKSYVITSRKRLDEYLKKGESLNNVELRVGILSGKPRYPKGHRGRAADRADADRTFRVKPEELERRAAMRELRKSLRGLDPKTRKQALKEIRAAFKAKKISTKGLATRRSKKGTAVAKVAGVLHSRTQYHVLALDERRVVLRRELEDVNRAILRQGDPYREIRQIGQNTKAAVRASMARAGHVDSGRLLRTTQFEIINRQGEINYKQVLKTRRKLRRQVRAQRRAARKAAL